MSKINRRSFLKLGGAGIAGLTLSGLKLPSFAVPSANASNVSEAWKFGVMADTQWVAGTGSQPGSCAVSIIDALNQQFINHGCKFVIQVGDLVDVESVAGFGRTLPTRAAHAQALYDAGIGFFPVRGNHEGSATAAGEVKTLFPQTQGLGSNLFGATNFQSPNLVPTSTDPLGTRLKGLSYAFDYNNVRCIFIDQFTRADNTNNNNTTNDNAIDQVAWVDDMLFNNPVENHSFVFAHKNLIGQNHKDVLFGGNLAANPTPRDNFITSLYNNETGFFFSGHDHMHHHSMVRNSSGNSKVRQIICSSNSYKFYTPAAGDDGREIPVGQELYTIGYYIVTVDGSRVVVDFYSSSKGPSYGAGDLTNPPGSYTFYLRETFGYSLIGRQFDIPRGGSYAGIADSCGGTAMNILSGSNGNNETDYLGRQLEKTVNTGWTDSDSIIGAAGKQLTLWGMADNLSLYSGSGSLPSANESMKGDTYALSLTYDPTKARPSQLVTGKMVLASKNPSGVWTNAVDLNFDSAAKTFKYGSWKPSYGLGTYGVDPSTSTVWAVINHQGDFVAKLI